MRFKKSTTNFTISSYLKFRKFRKVAKMPIVHVHQVLHPSSSNSWLKSDFLQSRHCSVPYFYIVIPAENLQPQPASLSVLFFNQSFVWGNWDQSQAVEPLIPSTDFTAYTKCFLCMEAPRAVSAGTEEHNTCPPRALYFIVTTTVLEYWLTVLAILLFGSQLPKTTSSKKNNVLFWLAS